MLEYEVFLLEYRRSNCEETESFLCEASVTETWSNQDTFGKKLEWTIQIRAHLLYSVFTETSCLIGIFRRRKQRTIHQWLQLIETFSNHGPQSLSSEDSWQQTACKHNHLFHLHNKTKQCHNLDVLEHQQTIWSSSRQSVPATLWDNLQKSYEGEDHVNDSIHQ